MQETVSAFLTQLKSLNPLGLKLKDLPLGVARGSFSTVTGLAERPAPDLPWVDEEIAGIAVRRYRPAAARPGALFVYIHGGGFVIGSPETHHSLCAQIAVHLGMELVSVGYRLAPEHQFPAAFEDCFAVVDALAQRAPRPLFVGGDSAGGTLAAATAQQFRQQVHGQLLLYPVTDFANPGESMRTLGSGFMLEAADMDWFRDSFVPAGTSLADPRLSPVYGKLSGLPPTVIVTCGLDPLRDQGIAYAEALAAAGTRVVHHRLEGVIHGCFNMRKAIPAAQTALLAALDALEEIAR